MKKYFILVIIFIFISNGCSAKKAIILVKQNGEPNIYQVKLIKYHKGFIKVKASGKNGTLKEAINDSQKSALWYVLEGSATPLLNTEEKKKKFKKFKTLYYKNRRNYFQYSSDILSKQKINNSITVVIDYEINTRLLKNDLLKSGVFKTSDLKTTTHNIVLLPANSVTITQETLDFIQLLKVRLTKEQLKVKIDKNSEKSDIYVTSKITISNISPTQIKATVLIESYHTKNNKKFSVITYDLLLSNKINKTEILDSLLNKTIDKLLDKLR